MKLNCHICTDNTCLKLEEKDMNKQTNLRSIEKFNPNASAKVASILYDSKVCRFNLKLYGQRMLFCLASGINQTDLFCEYMIDKGELYKYLGLTTTNRRNDLLADALKELMSGGLDIRRVNKKTGKKVWEGLTWITGYKFTEDSERVWIKVNEDAMPYLFAVQQFAEIKPDNYLKLPSAEQTWFYPLFKKWVNVGKYETNLQYLIDSLDLTATDSYNEKKCRNWRMNILRWVLGIVPSAASKEELKLAKKEKREPRFIAWDYATDKKGEPTGTLYSISKNTDIQVHACVLKENGSYNRIVFKIDWKIEKMTAGQRKKLEAKIQNAAEMDMGARQDMKNRGSSIEAIPVVQAEEVGIPQLTPHFYEFNQLFKAAHEAGIDFDEYVKAGRFVEHPSGKWYKR